MIHGVLCGLFGGFVGIPLAIWLNRYKYPHVFIAGVLGTYFGIPIIILIRSGLGYMIDVIENYLLNPLFMLFAICGGLLLIFFALLGRLNIDKRPKDEENVPKSTDLLGAATTLKFAGSDGIFIVNDQNFASSTNLDNARYVLNEIKMHSSTIARRRDVGFVPLYLAVDPGFFEKFSQRGNARVIPPTITVIYSVTYKKTLHRPSNFATRPVLCSDEFCIANNVACPTIDGSVEVGQQCMRTKKLRGSQDGNPSKCGVNSFRICSLFWALQVNINDAGTCTTTMLVLDSASGRFAIKIAKKSLASPYAFRCGSGGPIVQSTGLAITLPRCMRLADLSLIQFQPRTPSCAWSIKVPTNGNSYPSSARKA